ncbi:MAG: MOSC domain-containing protein [Candidatus Marinimicrobia bacterium]|nr:MOSC domain-containing protein [Candidatus Neomarinimicrobiota bacterium]MCF7839810.1 MOSC domain-containing protein [Candidatus Neomarinimicrobiota bacterium]MCF7901844.1 MOSC domain-containing protein [Candidatus Neomarinimicrobiota bacterium]
MTQPHIYQISISPGGVPKMPVESAEISIHGLVGDYQNDQKHHGGPQRAVCLYALEVIEALKAEGHPIFPGSTGENITTAGLDWGKMKIGQKFQLGQEVILEITDFTAPCKTIRHSFSDEKFIRISPKLHPGDSRIYAKVILPGKVQTGDEISRLSS